jgi:hypothetical protein
MLEGERVFGSSSFVGDIFDVRECTFHFLSSAVQFFDLFVQAGASTWRNASIELRGKDKIVCR